MPKQLTWDRVATMKDRAERFLSNVLQDDFRADSVADESVEDYADRKGITITQQNPTKGKQPVAALTKADLQARIEELEAENSELNDQLDSIQEIIGGDDSDDDEDDDSDDDEDEADQD